MTMTTYQAAFAVLVVFFLGDFIGAITKAKISSMFVIMMGFLILFMTKTYPAKIMEIAGFAGLARMGQYFLLFNMGTSIDIATLKREWRTVLCATIGMAAAIAGCFVAMPVVGYEYALASAPVVNGGIVATTTMVDACTKLGFTMAAALATFVYAVQKFVGTLPASNCGLKVAKEMVEEMRAKHAADPNYNWYNEQKAADNTEKKTFFWEKYKKYYTAFICLTVASGAIWLANILGNLTHGWVNMAIWCMLLGVFCRNYGLVPPNTLRDYAKANGFFAFLSLCTIIPSLAKVDWSQIPVIGVKAAIIFALVVLFNYIVFFFTPLWKIVGSKHLSIGIAMCQLIGYPGTELIANEITNAVAVTDEERDAVSSKIRTAYVISGFTSVTILSVFIASFLAKFMGA
jgi:hypothetical protein